MYFRFRVVEGDEVTFTKWTVEPDNTTASNAQRVAIATEIRAAQPNAEIYTERSQAIPSAAPPTD